MSAGFTPGPWEVHSGYLVRKCDDDGVCCPIAEVRSPYRIRVGLVRGYKEEWHNGHLIATAPELYNALYRIAVLVNAGSIEGLTPEAVEALGLADPMTAKARGEQVAA